MTKLPLQAHTGSRLITDTELSKVLYRSDQYIAQRKIKGRDQLDQKEFDGFDHMMWRCAYDIVSMKVLTATVTPTHRWVVTFMRTRWSPPKDERIRALVRSFELKARVMVRERRDPGVPRPREIYADQRFWHIDWQPWLDGKDEPPVKPFVYLAFDELATHGVPCDLAFDSLKTQFPTDFFD